MSWHAKTWPALQLHQREAARVVALKGTIAHGILVAAALYR
jgi:hypothetical protein